MLIGRVSPAPHPSMDPHCPTVPPRPCHAACLLPQPNPASCPSRRPTLQITQPLVLPAGPCLSHPFCLCKCCSSCRECTPQHTHTCFNSWVCPCDLFRKPSLHPLCGCFCEAPCTVHCTQPVPAPPGSPPDSAAGDGPAPGQLCLAGLCPPRGPGPGPRTQKDAGKGSTRRNPSHGKGMPCCPQTGRWPPGSAIFTSPPAEPRLARQVLQLSQ